MRPDYAELERVTARSLEKFAQPTPVLDGNAVPAGGLEHAPQPVDGDIGDHPVEGLAVEVHDPHHLSEPGDRRVRYRLPARPFVELRVANERYLAPLRGSGGRSPPRSGQWRPGQPTRWRSPQGRGLWSGWGRFGILHRRAKDVQPRGLLASRRHRAPRQSIHGSQAFLTGSPPLWPTRRSGEPRLCLTAALLQRTSVP